LRARFVSGEARAVQIGAPGLAAFDHAFAGEAIHDGHDGGVGAGAALGQLVANVADGGFAERPERVHAIELERGEIEDGAAAEARWRRARAVRRIVKTVRHS